MESRGRGRVSPTVMDTRTCSFTAASLSRPASGRIEYGLGRAGQTIDLVVANRDAAARSRQSRKQIHLAEAVAQHGHRRTGCLANIHAGAVEQGRIGLR